MNGFGFATVQCSYPPLDARADRFEEYNCIVDVTWSWGLIVSRKDDDGEVGVIALDDPRPFNYSPY